MIKILAFQSSAFNHWASIIGFGIVSLMLLIANILRQKIPFFKKLLFPTAIIAGFIGLGVKYLFIYFDFNIDGIPLLTNSFLEAITYHTIALGFIAMGLKSVKKGKTNKYNGRPFKTGLLIVNTYLLQAIIGLVVTMIFSLMFSKLAAYAGVLLPMGFGQGPGQAGNIGGVFEDNGFIGGKTFGLAIATIGTLWACVAGIYYINKRAKEGKVRRYEKETGKTVTTKTVEHSQEIPISEAIDKMSIQIIFVVVVYLFSFLFMKGLTSIITIPAFASLIWGFNFIFGMLFAIIAKLILKGLKKLGWMKRKYTNEYMLNRISGVVFDYMIVASIMAINIELLAHIDLWVALLVMTTIAGFITYFYLKLTIYYVYPDYKHEAFATLFGNLTGTASNGIALLREIDPEFSTPAADDLVTGSSTAIMFGAPILVITGIIYLPEWYYIWGSLSALIIFFIVFSFFLYKKEKPKQPQ